MNGQDFARPLPAAVTGSPVDRLAFLFDAHYDRLYRLARRLTGRADDAPDLVQETFLRAAKYLKSIPAGASNEEAWLVRVLVNVRRDQWRKSSVRERHKKYGLAGSKSTSTSQHAEGSLIARNAVWQALDLLPPRRRAIVVMHEIEGLAVPAIASLLGVTAVTVRWHLSVGKRDLTGALKTYLGGAK